MNQATSDSMSTLVSQFLDHKERSNRRPEYIKTLRSYLGRFIAGRESEPVTTITEDYVEKWFNERHDSPAGRCSGIGRLQSFFTFLEKRRKIESNPMRWIERPTVERHAPVILSPDEALRLLNTTRECRPKLLPYITLGLFCGIRPAEMMHMDWPDLSLEPRDIKELKGYGLATVSSAASKVRRRRIVPIPPTALAWLRLCSHDGKLVPYTRTQWLTQYLADLAKIQWSHDILRHTAASYLLAKFEDCGRVAHWLGNSPNVLLNHYYQLVDPTDCDRFWSITP